MPDDLRTRAQEAAYSECANDEQGDAFVAGYLAHAAQQPSREQIAATQRNLMFCADHVGNGAWEDDEDEPCEDCWRHRYDTADAVLRLMNGEDNA